MIKVNLLEKKKITKLPTVGGINFSDFNWKGFIIALIVYYGPSSYFDGVWKSEVAKLEASELALRKKLRKIKKEVRKDKNIKEKLDLYNRQVEKLKQRSVQVDKIIQTKTNPKKVLESLTRDLPENLWFESLSIDSEKKVSIRGGALSYQNIGDFIISANASPFFGNSLNLSSSSSSEENLDGLKVKVERFEIKGVIETYDPFSQ